ncbi:hypothetical protein OROMI_001356 [Orobanche minor]
MAKLRHGNSTKAGPDDTSGNAIHCTAKGTISHNFIRLKEGGIYSIKNFVVLPNKDEYRIRKDDNFMLEFDGDTTMRKALVKSDGFLRHPLQLVHFQKIETTANKYLIDVVGYVTNVGRTNQTRTGTKNLDFHLANQRGQSIRVTLWGGLGDALIEKKTKHVGLYKLYLSSSSSTLILDDPEIPALKELVSEMSDVEMTHLALHGNHSEPNDGTIENLLIWSHNHKNDSLIFNCKAKIDTVGTRKGWSYPSCGGEKCKKSATRKEGRYWCDACDVPVPYPVMRYRLELGISDETADTVIVLFDEPATELVKCSAASILDEEDESSDDHANLPPAIANLIGTTHVFELKSHTYYEYGSFESFTCWKVDPLAATVESACSINAPAETAPQGTSFKRLVRQPSVPTPSKRMEVRKTKRAELEDSDLDDASIAAEDGQEDVVKNPCMLWKTLNEPMQVIEKKLHVSVMEEISTEVGRRSIILPCRPCHCCGLPVENAVGPYLSHILHNSMVIRSHTTVRHDGRVQSFCGLQLSEIIAQESGVPY